MHVTKLAKPSLSDAWYTKMRANPTRKNEFQKKIQIKTCIQYLNCDSFNIYKYITIHTVDCIYTKWKTEIQNYHSDRK